jgi:AhpD family alkylhydroperoxidase
VKRLVFTLKTGKKCSALDFIFMPSGSKRMREFGWKPQHREKLSMKNHRSVPARNKSLRPSAVSENVGSADPRLLELVRLRVAQIHQSPISIEMHLEGLRVRGETEERLQQLETWATSGLFDGRERAALTLCEKITSDESDSLPDYLIQETRHYFNKGTLIKLTLAIMAVNDWHFLGGN